MYTVSAGLIRMQQVEIYMPPLKIFRAVTDKLKNITSQVSIHANMAGELHIAADDIAVSAEISFKGLSTAQPEGGIRFAPMHS